MAYTYNNLPVLSKVKIGESLYYLKDAELRALVDTFGDAVGYNATADGTLALTGALVTAGAVKTYVDDAVAGLAGAMHFIGVKDELPTTGNTGDVVIVGTAEYVWEGEWKLIGDEGVYATKAGVEAAYVKKTLTIAGIDLQDAISADELKEALGLKALAYKDSASGTFQGVTGVVDAKYTPAGSVSVNLKDGSATMSASGTFTPAGTVNGSVTAAGTVAIARDDANGVQVSGTVSAPTITVTPNTEAIQHIATLGSLPTYTAAKYTAPSVTEASSQFATAGLTASINGEELVFTAAATSAALTGTGFNAGSYEAAVFSAGELPTLGEAKTVVTGIASASATAPVFTGDKFGATFAGENTNITATFAGTESNVAVTGNYEKPYVESAAFAGTEATIAHEVTKEAITVTVQ